MRFTRQVTVGTALVVLGLCAAACGDDGKAGVDDGAPDGGLASGSDAGALADGGASSQPGADAQTPSDAGTDNDAAIPGPGVYSVSTIAGSKSGLPGDANGSLDEAQFALPLGVRLDPNGDLIVLETQRRVRKISGDTVSLVLQLPLSSDARGSAFASDGDLYFADHGRHCIARLTPEGTSAAYAGDCLGAEGIVNGDLSAARFRDPNDIVLDSASGTFYVADTGNRVIRKISADGQVSTLVGSGTSGMVDGVGMAAQFRNPVGLALDGKGNLYVTEGSGHRIRKIELTTLSVTTLAGNEEGFQDGQGVAAAFNVPRHMVYDGAGHLYVTDSKNHRIRRVSLDGLVETVAGAEGPGTVPGGPGSGFKDSDNALEAFFSTPFGIDRDAQGNLYVSESSGGNRIRKLTRKQP